MSLTSHLDSPASPIGEFLRTRFAQTAVITKETNPQLRAAPCLQPLITPGEYYPYGTIGQAIDYRIRYAFALMPAVKTAARIGARLLLEVYGVPMSDRAQIFDPFFAFVDAEAARLRPIQRALAKDDEERLSQICFVLGLFEEVFRSARPADSLLQFMQTRLKPGVRTDDVQFIEALLGLAQPNWVDDIRQMSTLFLERGQWLFNRPFILNPSFAGSRDVGGADADLIVDGCLIDIKSSKKPQLDPVDLRQLVGYVLLDYQDEHTIRSVAVYKARYGLTFTWPVEELLSRLAGQPTVSLSDLRAEFQAVCQ